MYGEISGEVIAKGSRANARPRSIHHTHFRSKLSRQSEVLSICWLSSPNGGQVVGSLHKTEDERTGFSELLDKFMKKSVAFPSDRCYFYCR